MLVKFKSKEFEDMIHRVAVRRGKVRLQTFLNEIEQLEARDHELKVYWRNSKGFLESNSIDIYRNYSSIDKGRYFIDLDKLSNLKALTILAYSKVYPHKWSRGLERLSLSSSATQSALPILHEFTKLKSLSCEQYESKKISQLPQNIANQLECFEINHLYDMNLLNGMDNLLELHTRDLKADNIADMPKLEKLTRLIIGCGKLYDLEMVSKIPNVDYLCINGSLISDLSYITKLPNLTYLCIASANLSSIEQLRDSKIEVLEVSDNMIEDISPTVDMQLSYLCISNNPVDDLSALSCQKELELLHFRGTLVTDITPILELESLKEISLDIDKLSDKKQLTLLKAKPIINGEYFDDCIKKYVTDSEQAKAE